MTTCSLITHHHNRNGNIIVLLLHHLITLLFQGLLLRQVGRMDLMPGVCFVSNSYKFYRKNVLFYSHGIVSISMIRFMWRQFDNRNKRYFIYFTLCFLIRNFIVYWTVKNVLCTKLFSNNKELYSALAHVEI